MPDPRDRLLVLLSRYSPDDRDQQSAKDRIRQFVLLNPRCFERSLVEGHITASAWIVDRTRTHALLHHHRKLGRWLQPGGHADGEADVLCVALKEAREETGMVELRPISHEIFDLDVHEIPARGADPAHYHHDVRFLIEGDRNATPVASDESREVTWIPLATIGNWTSEESVLRMVRKTPPGVRVGI
jgi:8-oxo-dGTP pyrophosphatase MutT (NUDIX family)